MSTCIPIRNYKSNQSIVTADADDLPDPENAPLLQPQPSEVVPIELRMRERTGLRFYITLFQHRKFVAGAVSYFVFAILTASFDTTLPLHVRDVFSWGSTQTGLLFVALQSPGIPLSPIVGWVKDRLGTRRPITIGFLVLTPLTWLLGVPGDERFPWANEGYRGHIIYSVTVALIGITICALNGAGTMEATSMLLYPIFVFSLMFSSGRRRNRIQTTGHIRTQWRILACLVDF